MATHATRLTPLDVFEASGGSATPAAKLFGTLPDQTKPIITNVVPPAGHAINPQDPLGFDVTDANNNLQRTTVLAYFPNGNGPGLPLFEVVYFGTSVGGFTSGFGPQYTGIRTPITNGFRFSGVIRLGNWPDSPTLVADAGDTAGNQSDP